MAGCDVRTLRQVFPRFTSRAHLDAAADFTLRGKRRRPDVAWFIFRRETVLRRLHDDLSAGRWRPAPLRTRLIHDPKPRIIVCPTIEDRIVHAAWVRLGEGIFLRSAIDTCFACRPGGGTHRAILAVQRMLRRHHYALHLDIRAYFPSVHLPTLRGLLARRIRDPRFLAVMHAILDGGAAIYRDRRLLRLSGLPRPHPADRGLPIGCLTSQLCAGFVYLNGLDHFVKRTLKVPGYIRYMDDLLLFGDRRADLRRWRAEVADWLQSERGLRLKHPDARILAARGHVDALGYRIRRDGLTVLPKTIRRLRGRLARAEDDPTIDPARLAEQVRSAAAWSLLG